MAFNRTTIGSNTNKASSTTWTIDGGVHVPGEATLALALAHDSVNQSGVIWNGALLGRETTTTQAGIRSSLWTLRRVKVGTGSLDVQLSSAATAKAATYYYISGVNRIDVTDYGTGSSTNPDSGLSALTNYDDELLVATVATEGPVEDTEGSWAYDVLTAGDRDGTTGGVADTNVTIADAWDTISAAAQIQSGKTGITSRAWVAITAAFYEEANVTTSWLKLVADTPYNGRRSAAMAYDAKRGEVVCFGGYDGTVRTDTYTWSGGAWTLKTPAHHPDTTHYYGCAAAYDETNEVVVLFGGGWTGAGGNQTWTWDGTDWTQLSPAHAPSARRFHTMCWDPRLSKVLLYGGDSGSTETWVWDGSDWTQLTPGTNPGDHRLHSMCYDSTDASVLLFGGQNAAVAQFTTWKWDGTDWIQLLPVTTPDSTSGYLGHFMFRRNADSTIYLVGGGSTATSAAAVFVYQWTGSDWLLLKNQCTTAVTPWTAPYAGTPPPYRYQGCATYSDVDAQAILFSGASGYGTIAGTWELLLPPIAHEAEAEMIGVAQISFTGLAERLASSVMIGVAAVSFTGLAERLASCTTIGLAEISFTGTLIPASSCPLRAVYAALDIKDTADISLDPPLPCSNSFASVALYRTRYLGFFRKV